MIDKRFLLVTAVLMCLAGTGCDPQPTPTPQVDTPVAPSYPIAPVAPVAPVAPLTTTNEDPKAPTPVTTEPEPPAESGLVPAEKRRELYLDLHFTDQDGKEVTLADLVGKPLAVTFIFTRCPRPDTCPLIVATMANLQKRIAEAGLGDDVRFLLISYDPAYDTPERLKHYGSARGIQFTNASMLRPSIEDMSEILNELGVIVIPSSDGSIGHALELILLDREGREAFWRRDTIWDSRQIVPLLEKLVAEQKEATSPSSESTSTPPRQSASPTADPAAPAEGAATSAQP